MGTPDDVAAAIRKWESVGYDGINFLVNFMEVLPQQYVLDSMRMFAEEVMPAFQEAPKAEAVTTGVN
jgi:alkanesulfonate monooxygenase SsuD/methylene tetrahydromethanopterin reductase-like flavin-dependent oxidoreductase (luciferase family)